MSRQGPVFIEEPCGCRVDHGIPYRCKKHALGAVEIPDTHTQVETLLERLITQAFVSGQMDAQATAQSKWKVGAGGPVKALSEKAYKLAQETGSELVETLQQENATLRDELETERLRLAACSVAALGNTAARAGERIQPGHPYYSASYGDVCGAVDREIQYREENTTLKAQLAKGERVFQAVVYAFEGQDVPADLHDHGMVKRGQKFAAARDAENERLRQALAESEQFQRGPRGREDRSVITHETRLRNLMVDDLSSPSDLPALHAGATALAITREIAEMTPDALFQVGDHYGDVYCALCGSSSDHDAGCIYVRCKKLHQGETV
jgi:hypothetical protein